MTSQISKALASVACRRMMVLVLIVVSFLSLHAQQSQPTMEQQLAALQRLEAMQPDSIQPKYQQAVLLLGTVCSQPQNSKVQQYIEEAQRVIQRIEALQPTKAADRSDLATLHGFYYTAIIVTNPQQNGPRYYRQALDSFDEALKLNPKNTLAQMLLERFKEGMGSSK
jgi:tetratricopeptide (TPR) repeat protein